ncbi:hypothetical protein [Sphingobacterium sp. LRF_L2]|uniref:hypothetical protein n=1 Tax=Sphingobacterium sp. LRF_L2 TaxID=3369421 RepID=UPI003F61D43A
MRIRRKQQSLDALMYQVDIDSIERSKCRGTGKVKFNSQAEATFFMYWLKWKYKRFQRRANSRKRGHGRPKIRFVYFCVYCDGYHLTKQHPEEYKRLKNLWERKYSFLKEGDDNHQ